MFVGARQVLASIRAHYPGMSLRPLVRVVTGERGLETFFNEVSEGAVFVAGACELQEIIKRVDKDVDGSEGA